MSIRYWYVENQISPRKRNNPTTVYRERACPTCQHAAYREVLSEGNTGLDFFILDGKCYSWRREGADFGSIATFKKYADAKRVLDYFREQQNGQTLSLDRDARREGATRMKEA